MEPKLLEYELVEVNKLIPYANNSRTHTDEQIAKVMASIKEFGFINPILITEEYVVTAGHCRLLAAQRLGLEKVPCIKENYLTPAQRKAYVIADNRLALDAGWDEDLLRIELEDLKDQAFDIEVIGFDEKEIDSLFREEKEVEDDGFDLDKALEAATFVKRGDLWMVGKHRMMCGDSTEPDDVNKLLGGTKVDFVVTDPPYNVNYKRKRNRAGIKNDKMSKVDFYCFLYDAYENMFEHMKPGANAFVFHSDSEETNFRESFRDVGFKWHQTWQWVKERFVLGHGWAHYQNEPILVGWKEGGPHYVTGDRDISNCLFFNRPKKSPDHPTMKPIDLVSYLVNKASREEDVCLDLFGGSGSTLIACEQTKRICYTMELDEKYASVILRRYVEDAGNEDGVYCLREIEKNVPNPDNPEEMMTIKEVVTIPYKDLVIELETNAKA